MSQALSGLLSWSELWIAALATSAFLALYWALRGAPIGQAAEDEGEDAPRAGYRDRVIAAMVAGLLLIVAGGYVALARSVPWSIPVFAAGFGIVLVLVARNQQYRHASPVMRRTLEFSNTALTAGLLAGILIVLNVLAFRYGGRPVDLTRERSFSLSELTEKQLASLDRPVKFTLFFGNSARARLLSDRVHQLLELYRVAGPRWVTLESIDPFQERDKYEAIVKRIPGVAVTEGGGVLIEYGGGANPPHSVVRNTDLIDVPKMQSDSFETSFRGEDAITSALVALREGKRPKIVFTTGHGEPPLDDGSPGAPAIGVWKARLTAMGADVTDVNLLDSDIPSDAALVVVVGPKTPLRADEVGRLRAYLDRGSPGLFLIGNQEPTGLEELLKSYNVALGKGLVIDVELNMNRRAQVVYVPLGGGLRHPVVDSLSGRHALMPSAAPLHALGLGGSAAQNNALMATPMLRTGRKSWAETELANQKVMYNEGKDEAGPITVGIAVTDRPRPGSGDEPKPRLIVLSSPLMAYNYFLDAEQTNQDLLMNSISWLRGRSDLQGILPNKHVALTLSAEPVLRFRLVMVPTVMAVILIVGLGITTYLARRE